MRRIRRRALLVPAGARARRSRARRRASRRRSVDPKLLEILVCPVTKGPLTYDREKQELDLALGAARLSGARRHSGDAGGRGARARAGRARERMTGGR